MAVLEWINHASFLLRSGEAVLAHDPWLEGTAFKGAWHHIAPTVFPYERFAEVTHLWISHQHPDHFAPPNLKKIPREDRARMTVFYRRTTDRLVVSWLRGNGFTRVEELEPLQWLHISGDLQIMMGAVGDDAWLAVRTGGQTILNLNDCVLRTRERIAPIAAAVGPVDVLLTQFSYAQWVGNPGEFDRHRREALEKLERIRLQHHLLHPRAIVPFASFVYFCHEENFFMNEPVNTVADAASFIERELGAVAAVLYPGDRWNTQQSPADWREGARRYRADFDARLAAGPLVGSRIIDEREAMGQIDAFFARLQRKNPRALHLLRGRTTVHVWDTGKTYALSARGIRAVSLREGEADISTSFDALLYAFKTPWGGNALHVGGRFRSYVPGGHLRFFKLLQGLHYYNVTRVNMRWAGERASRAVSAIRRRLTGRRRDEQPA